MFFYVIKLLRKPQANDNSQFAIRNYQARSYAAIAACKSSAARRSRNI